MLYIQFYPVLILLFMIYIIVKHSLNMGCIRASYTISSIQDYFKISSCCNLLSVFITIIKLIQYDDITITQSFHTLKRFNIASVSMI